MKCIKEEVDMDSEGEEEQKRSLTSAAETGGNKQYGGGRARDKKCEETSANDDTLRWVDNKEPKIENKEWSRGGRQRLREHHPKYIGTRATKEQPLKKVPLLSLCK